MPVFCYVDERVIRRMKIVKVAGNNNQHKIFVYTNSSCGWCKKTKKFLKENNIEYDYVDVDHSSRDEREEIGKHILEMGGRLSFPAIIIDDTKVINGFRKDEIMQHLSINKDNT